MPDHKIQRVAVIGAGISGVVSAGHLLAAGIEVTVFERSNAAGGVWVYDKRIPIEAQYPSLKPTHLQEFVKDEREGKERQILIHAPPGPCYVSLTNNVSTPLLRTSLNDWPNSTPDYVKHNVLKEYIQDTSKKSGADENTIYGALVTSVYKDGQNWHIVWKQLQEDAQGDGLVEEQRESVFDAVVVASGHYHTPLVPDIPGLAEAKEKWPSKITHSKSFRTKEGFEGKNVLLIGGAVSSLDIAKEISPVANRVYQSTRNGSFDLPATALPKGASRVAEVTEFKHQPSDSSGHLPLAAQLKSGETLEGIDSIVLATGYQMTLPFFPQFNNNSIDVTEADESVLITDGTQIHNLHRDIFYIPDSTLAFVGIPFYTATFSLFDFQAIAVAAHFSGVAQLPPQENLRAEYQDRVKTKGYRREFHSLKGEEEGYVDRLLEWVNPERARHGLPRLEGHSASWREAKEALVKRMTALLDGTLETEKGLQRPAEVEALA